MDGTAREPAMLIIEQHIGTKVLLITIKSPLKAERVTF